MAYVHQYPLYLHRDDGSPGTVVEAEADLVDRFRQGFKLWTPDGLVNPLDASVPDPSPLAAPRLVRKKKGTASHE